MSSSKTGKPKLLLVGGGKMGGALLQRVASQAISSVVDPAPKPAPLKSLDVPWLASADKLDPHYAPDIIVLAVKPQQMAAVLPSYARFANSVFLSIAAGMTVARLHAILGNTNAAIVRAMPNLPASVGLGVSVAVANRHVKGAQRMLCDKVLSAVGQTAWIDDENLLDAVTALSGSGPAYIFALTEAMTDAGTALGLPCELAAQLARRTIIGSAALLDKSGESAEALRLAVTSPGGTTEAALKHLLAAGGLPDLMKKAMAAAAQRSKELAR